MAEIRKSDGVNRAFYSDYKNNFESKTDEQIIGQLSALHTQDLLHTQTLAWIEQLPILRKALKGLGDYKLYLEFLIPRMGKRIDAVCLTCGVIFVIEFKTNDHFSKSDQDQVEDYALDLKNFHGGSHNCPIVPLLVSVSATTSKPRQYEFAIDLVWKPVCLCEADLEYHIQKIAKDYVKTPIDISEWEESGYKPTPTIIEAAKRLYAAHDVRDLRNFDAGAQNLSRTQKVINDVIDESRRKKLKSICFVTGVPGAGKTFAGLNVASERADKSNDMHAVFLSGNGPLVDVLREALTRDEANRKKISKKDAGRKVKSFIQPVHHWRNEYLEDGNPPSDHIVVFDEAQRAWTKDKTASFLKAKKGKANFDQSEPEFLLSVMDRHEDWCTVVCLVGGGQEINTGEAGISEWLKAIESRFKHWHVHISSHITNSDYALEAQAQSFLTREQVKLHEDLHLNVSMRSFRAESVSEMISELLNRNAIAAKQAYEAIKDKYPIHLTRDIEKARLWLKQKARGTERIGLVASSGGLRLKPEGVHVKAEIEPENWFLNDKHDVRSSYALEDVATQFDVQGLELDWVGVCWDVDYRRQKNHWTHYNFSGSRWLQIKDDFKRLYLKNTYRVILTRARQGMIIFVPKGNNDDPTRLPSYYDEIFIFLKSCGFEENIKGEDQNAHTGHTASLL